jgi:hypothetical protein
VDALGFTRSLQTEYSSTQFRDDTYSISHFSPYLHGFAGLLLYAFHASTAPCKRYGSLEGFQQPDRSSGRSIVITSFLLTVIYLPLSTLAVHVITWSSDLWAVPNPYLNSTTNPPVVAPLGRRTNFEILWTSATRLR